MPKKKIKVKRMSVNNDNALMEPKPRGDYVPYEDHDKVVKQYKDDFKKIYDLLNELNDGTTEADALAQYRAIRIARANYL